MKQFLRKSVPVLMYHQVNRTDSKSSLVVSPEAFSRQMEWLERRNFRFFSLDDVVDRLKGISLGERSVAVTFDDGFQDNYDYAFPTLRANGRTAALFVVVNWVGQKGFIGWKEIRELAEEGFTIGSHSLTHRWLPRIPEEEELRKEIFDSKKKIEDEIGREVKHFCYPVGGVDQRVAEQVEAAGYRTGWVAAARPTLEVRNPFFCLRRIKVSPRDTQLLRFSFKAHGLKSLISV